MLNTELKNSDKSNQFINNNSLNLQNEDNLETPKIKKSSSNFPESKSNNENNSYNLENNNKIFTLSKLNDNSNIPTTNIKLFDYFDENNNSYEKENRKNLDENSEENIFYNTERENEKQNPREILSRTLNTYFSNQNNLEINKFHTNNEYEEYNQGNVLNTESDDNDNYLNQSNDLKNRIRNLNRSMNLRKSQNFTNHEIKNFEKIHYSNKGENIYFIFDKIFV